jgi:Cu/Ag efflux protein CusF
MKKLFPVIGLIFVLALALGAAWAMAASDHCGHSGRSGQPPSQVYSAVGVIKAIAPAKLTISHGPIPSLNWPAMTMDFALPEQSLAQGLQIEDRVRFDFVGQGSAFIIVDLEIME